MIEANLNHCRLVRDSLVGERTVDEQSFASVTVLGERLERLKKLDGMFEGVAFSDEAWKLARQQATCSV